MNSHRPWIQRITSNIDAMYLDYLKSGDVKTIDHFFHYFSKAIARL